MLLIGLTGSIATGKSTVSQLLSAPPHSLPVIDADLLARKAVEPGTYGYRRIVSYFGPTTPDLLLPLDGEDEQSSSNPPKSAEEINAHRARHSRPLNRPALGRRVFGRTPSRERDRKVLNHIVHPMVRLYMLRSVLYHYLCGRWAVVLDIPLLFESRLDVFCGTVIVVGVRDPTVQMDRLRARDPHLSAHEAKGRVESQVDVREKAEKALRRNRAVVTASDIPMSSTPATDLGPGLTTIPVPAAGTAASSSVSVPVPVAIPSTPSDRQATARRAQGNTRGYVIWNDGSKAELKEELAAIMSHIRASSPRCWTYLLWTLPPLTAVLVVWDVCRNWVQRRRWERELEGQKGKEGEGKL